jgi:hypothetical protein
MVGTSTACNTRWRLASAVAATLAWSADSSVARALIAGPVGFPRSVAGATSTRGSLRRRLVFHAWSNVRKNARSPSNAMLTGVTTGVPSRL